MLQPTLYSVILMSSSCMMQRMQPWVVDGDEEVAVAVALPDIDAAVLVVLDWLRLTMLLPAGLLAQRGGGVFSPEVHPQASNYSLSDP